MSTPILSCLDPGEDLSMYLAVSKYVVSDVLLKDQKGVQKPIYYISKTLVNAEKRYLTLEKLALEDGVCVYQVSSPNSAQKFDFMGQIAKWGTRLGLFDIQYRPKSSVKGQVLANFITEYTPREGSQAVVCNVETQLWRVFVNSTSNTMGAGAGIVIVSPNGVKVEHPLRLGFRHPTTKLNVRHCLWG